MIVALVSSADWSIYRTLGRETGQEVFKTNFGDNYMDQTIST